MPRRRGSKDKANDLDHHFLSEVNHLLRTSQLAREEAEQFANDIQNRKIKKQAMELIDDYDTGVM